MITSLDTSAAKKNEVRGDFGTNFGIGDWVQDRTGIDDPGLALAHDMLFGKPPKVSTEEASTLTAEQDAALKRMLEAGQVAQGAIPAATIDESGLSMEGVEGLRNKVAAEGGAGALGTLAAGSDSDEMRRQLTELMAPLQEEAQEQMKTVGREFSGGAGGFFGSERQAQDQGIQEEFAQAQSKTMAELVGSGQDRALAAGGQLLQSETGLAGTAMEGQTAQLQSALQVALANGNNEQAAAIQDSLNKLKSQELYQDLLGVKGKENIVLNEAGTSGIAGGVLGGVLGGMMG